MDRYRRNRFRDWSQLPSEVVEEIIVKLDCPLDVLRLSSACSTWLAASKRIRAKWRPANPWLILSEDTQDNPECIRTVYNPGNDNDKWCYLKLPETFEKHCWGSDLGWIVTYGLDLEINVFNPLTKSWLHLPPTKTMLPEVLIDRSCHSDCKYRQHWMREGHILKASVLKIGGGENNSGLLVAVIHAHKRSTGGYCTYVKSTYLSIARPGDTSWTLINIPEEIFIRDVLCWKDLLWFVDAKWYVDLNKGGTSFNAVELLLEPHPLIKNRCTSSSILRHNTSNNHDNNKKKKRQNHCRRRFLSCL